MERSGKWHVSAGRGSRSRTHLSTGCRDRRRQDLREMQCSHLSRARIPGALLACALRRLGNQSFS